MKHLLLLLTLATGLNAQTLRISNVVKEPSPGITRYELGDEKKQILFIEDNAIITEKDVEKADPSPSQHGCIQVSLTKTGTEKMIAATSVLQPGIDRIAIIIDGKLLSAPVVSSVPLGKNFLINNLDDDKEAIRLAAHLSGKSAEEIEEIAAAEKRKAKLPPPTYHTDEEYQQLAESRSKHGIHYMDRLYTKEELDEILTKGMSLEQVTKLFGKPYLNSPIDDDRLELTFHTAPEKFPLEKKYCMKSFITIFEDGKLISWRPFSYSETTREPKPLQQEPAPSNLIIIEPPFDLSSPDFNLIEALEKIEISLKPGTTKPTEFDISQLLSIALMTCNSADENATIDPTCDLISTLAAEFPEIQKLAEKHKDTKLPLAELTPLITPIFFQD